VVSKSPGCTKQLTFFKFPKLHGYLIDAPGYGKTKSYDIGYADISVEAVKKWQAMIVQYARLSPRLCRIYVLLNIQHGLKENDDWMLKQLSELNIDISVVLTKVDKIPEDNVYNKMLMFSNILNKRYANINPLLHAVSSKTKFGVDMLRHSLIEAFEVKEPRNVDGDE
jgi:GTP-binding protein